MISIPEKDTLLQILILLLLRALQLLMMAKALVL